MGAIRGDRGQHHACAVGKAGLQPGTLTTAGVEHFDGWAANFGLTVTALELAPDASTYRMNTRFARFANVPDLLRMFRWVADVRTGGVCSIAAETY